MTNDRRAHFESLTTEQIQDLHKTYEEHFIESVRDYTEIQNSGTVSLGERRGRTMNLRVCSERLFDLEAFCGM